MMTQLLSRIHKAYQASFLLIILLCMGTVALFWKIGFLDGTRDTEVYVSNYILEQVQSEKKFSQIQQLVLSENSKLALDELSVVEKDLDQVARHFETVDYSPVKKSLGNVKKAMSNLISFPRMQQVFVVFSSKLEKFHEYVSKNNWRTLTRSSKRLMAYTQGHVDPDKLLLTIDSINREFDNMNTVTENSVLEHSEKAQIISRINNMNIELKMLRKYHEERQFYLSMNKDFQAALKKWAQQLSPLISIEKMKIEKNGRTYLLGTLVLLAVSLTFFMLSFVFQRYSLKVTRRRFESEIIDLVSESLLKGDFSRLDKMSDRLQSFVHQTHAYIDKRMGLGSIFQEALPFSSILLDQNLKLIWANSPFLSTWQLEEGQIGRSQISWDYLQKFTNIGDQDPVFDALKQNVAGIYQVQVRHTNQEHNTAYEMYVSPVKYKNHTRVMVFFYPLASLEETIQDQARCIINPINKAIDSLIDQSFSQLQDDEVFIKEFEINDMIGVYDKFVVLDEERAQTRRDFKEKLAKLESNLADVSDIHYQVSVNAEEELMNEKSQISYLKGVRNEVIALSGLAQNFEDQLRSMQLNTDELVSVSEHALRDEKILKSCVEEMLESFPKFDDVKTEIKNQRSYVSEAKMRLAHSLAQMTQLKKKFNDPIALERFNKSYQRISQEFSYFEEAWKLLEKKFVSLEVILSKSQMMQANVFEKVRPLQLENTQQSLQALKSSHLQLSSVLSVNEGVLAQNEQEVVEQLKGLYSSFKVSHSATKENFKLLRSYSFKSESSTDSNTI